MGLNDDGSLPQPKHTTSTVVGDDDNDDDDDDNKGSFATTFFVVFVFDFVMYPNSMVCNHSTDDCFFSNGLTRVGVPADEGCVLSAAVVAMVDGDGDLLFVVVVVVVLCSLI